MFENADGDLPVRLLVQRCSQKTTTRMMATMVKLDKTN